MGAEEQIEQAGQAREAKDAFDRNVTLSIAITAALLAAVSMMGQNADNEAILTQGEALRAQTEAALKSNEATNKWGQFQANNIRGHMYRALSDLLELQSDPPKKVKEKMEAWRAKFEKYEYGTLPALEAKANEFQEESRKALAEAQEKIKESELVQKRADRFDFGELGLQLGVVFCSLAILTKNPGLWYAGLTTSVLGLMFALSGFFGWFLG